MDIIKLEQAVAMELGAKSREIDGERLVTVEEATAVAAAVAKSCASALKAVRAMEGAGGNARLGEAKFTTIYRAAATLYAEEHLNISMHEACSRALTMWDVLVGEFEKRLPGKVGAQ